MIVDNKKAGELIAIGIWPSEAMRIIEKGRVLSCDQMNITGKQSEMVLKSLFQMGFGIKPKRNWMSQNWVKNYTLAFNGK